MHMHPLALRELTQRGEGQIENKNGYVLSPTQTSMMEDSSYGDKGFGKRYCHATPDKSMSHNTGGEIVAA
jgi:hypothetical protein